MSTEHNDIITHPHFQSERHPPMPMINRAAQFSPFAALTGYGEAVAEAARHTDEKIIPDETQTEKLNRQLKALLAPDKSPKSAVFTYFEPDLYKSGGRYVAAEGYIKKADSIEKTVTLTDGTVIPMEHIIDINPVFPQANPSCFSDQL